jgi:ABC-type transport system involved in multi-copper enzyme maturation permease subunit
MFPISLSATHATPLQNWRAIRAIIRKDLRVALQSKAVLLPMIIVPVVLVVLLPALVALVPLGLQTIDPAVSQRESADLAELWAIAPVALKEELAGYALEQAVIVFMLLYLFAPLYLIVPMMVSSVIAADSFAGEKERKTLEALVYSPTSDQELLLAKLLAAWLPGVAVALGAFVLYGVVVNLAAWPLVGRIFFPNAMWLLLAFWVAPATAALGLSITVMVSARVNTFQEAYQMGSLVVLPIIMLLIGQMSGAFYLHVGFVALLGLALWLLDALLFWLATQHFRRSRLIERL